MLILSFHESNAFSSRTDGPIKILDCLLDYFFFVLSDLLDLLLSIVFPIMVVPMFESLVFITFAAKVIAITL